MDMAESLGYPELSPGAIIEFNDITELPAFEDALAEAIDPDMTPARSEAWQGRVNIQNLIRPHKFYGRITDVHLEVMAEPYQRLIDARERGWQVGRGGSYRLTSKFADQLIPQYRGFIFRATALRGRMEIDQIRAELWYYPVSVTSYIHPESGKVCIYKETEAHSGCSVIRVVAKPKMEADFIKLDAMAKKIGADVLRAGLKKPLVQPMRD